MRLLALVISLVFALTACGGSTETPTAPTPEVDVDTIYLKVVRDNDSSLVEVPDDTLLEFADHLCDYFDSGGTFAGATAMGRSQGIPGRTTAILVGSATAAYCPKHESKFSSAS